MRTAHPGFSLVEILVMILIITVLATVVVVNFRGTREAVVADKLTVDVAKLNQIISLYLAEGGSLDSVSTPQAILDKLKTVRTKADSARQIGVMTGRAIDVRLAAHSGSSTAGSRKAVWNATTKRFEITSGAASNGVSDFYLDDSLLTVNYPTESRTRSAMLYNDVNGWVWSPGSAANTSYLTPVDVASTELSNNFDPYLIVPTTTTTSATTTSTGTTSTSTTSTSTTSTSTTSTGTTSTSTTSTSTTSTSTTSTGTTSTSTTSVATPTTLPKPINSPSGGTFTAGAFPTTVTVNKNGAPATGSVTKYRITPAGGSAGAWTNYTSPVTIAAGNKFESQNVSTDAVLYNNSSIDADTYYKLVDSFTATDTPSWINVAGGPALKYSVNNTNPAAIGLSHGDTRLDLGGGEYLDAGVENRLDFTRVNFSGVAANTDFSLGELVILNGTTFNDSEATSATLKLVLNLTAPVTQTNTVNLNYTMTSTPNSSDRLASADTVTLSNPTTTMTVATAGVTYTLQVRIVSLDTDSGIVSGNTFYIYEGASARAQLVGKFVSNK